MTRASRDAAVPGAGWRERVTRSVATVVTLAAVVLLTSCGDADRAGRGSTSTSTPTSAAGPGAGEDPAGAVGPEPSPEAFVGEVPEGDDAVVVRVVDGDTILVAVGDREERVRLIGIDTPETVHPDRAVECFGREASARTTRLVGPGTDIRLVYDVERTDRFGRTLAYVYRLDDGLFVNLALVLDGYAQIATFPPNVAHVDDLLAAQRAARDADRGLWSACADEVAEAERPPGDDPDVVPIGECTARLSDPEPRQHTTTTVVVESDLADRPVAAVAHYRTTSTTRTGRLGPDGTGEVDFRIGGATVGVEVRVVISVDGGLARCETSFTPRS